LVWGWRFSQQCRRTPSRLGW